MKKIFRFISITIVMAVVCIILSSPVLAYNTSTVNQTNIISLGENYTAVIATDGSLWIWGQNSYNQNRGGDTSNYAKVPVKAMDNVISVNCGRYSTAVIKADNSLWMWGNNTYGQFTALETYDLTKVMDNAVAVSCGANHFAAIKTDGSLWMWGKNTSGQLGIGSTDSDVHDPAKIMDGVIAVSCGDAFTAAVKSDGTLWMWGYNNNGELGNGTKANSSTPVKVMNNVSSVSCGEFHTAAIKDDGTLWLWGYNKKGELGNGTSENSSIPVKIMDNVSSVSCGGMYSDKGGYTAAIKTDGTLWMWGYNGKGQLGTGTRESSSVPVKVMDNVVSVSCSGGLYSDNGHTAAVKRDGTVWIWGANRYGQLGNGTNSNSNSPIQVSGLTAALPKMTTDTDPKYIFTDVVKEAYYSDSVQWAVENGITNGTGGNTFSPNAPCTQAQIITFLYRALGEPTVIGENLYTYKTIAPDKYYYNAMLWAYQHSIITNTNLDPDSGCTRSDVVVYLWRLEGKPSAGSSNFTDVPSSADYAQAVAWAVQQGITTGTSGTTFSPNDTCTRGQIVTFLYRDMA